jgi:hypothetical protein
VLHDHIRKYRQTIRHYDLSGYEEKLKGEDLSDAQIEKKQELKTLLSP